MNFLFPEHVADDIKTAILSILRCYSAASCIIRRLEAIKLCNEMLNMSKVAKEIGASPSFVRKWRDRAKQIFSKWPTTALSLKEIRLHLLRACSDEPRKGASATYDTKQFVELMTLALKPPTECGREITHWTIVELTEEANLQGIAPGISVSTVGRFLREADIRPHHITYWLEPKIEDEETFNREVNEICDTYHQASNLAKQDTFVISVDEKTGIQALERLVPNKPMKQGLIEKREFEYKRHGTLSLTPSFDVVTGKVIQHRIGETRGEVDFCEHIMQTVALSPDSTWIFVADQLNVHKSESLVRYIAESCGITDDLGKKGKKGILKNQVSRQKFLTDKSHRIRFVFTPKHCSWLNQVEIWFGVISKKLLNRGNFSSLEDLNNKMERFIKYFNESLAKPYKWTYKGKALSV